MKRRVDSLLSSKECDTAWNIVSVVAYFQDLVSIIKRNNWVLFLKEPILLYLGPFLTDYPNAHLCVHFRIAHIDSYCPERTSSLPIVMVSLPWDCITLEGCTSKLAIIVRTFNVNLTVPTKESIFLVSFHKQVTGDMCYDHPTC